MKFVVTHRNVKKTRQHASPDKGYTTRARVLQDVLSAKMQRGVCKHIVSSLGYHENKFSRYSSLDTIRASKLVLLAKNL